MRHYLLYIISLTLLFAACSSPERALKRGLAYYEVGEYYKAKPFLSKARRAKLKKDKGAANFYLGETNRHLMQFSRAATNYSYADRFRYQDSSLLLKWAQMLHSKEEYDLAAEKYSLYLERFPKDQVAKNGLYAVQHMDALKGKNPHRVYKAPKINSSRSDFAPSFINSRYTTMLFTSSRKAIGSSKLSNITGTQENDIYITRKDIKGRWSRPTPIEGGINTPFSEGVTSISGDGVLLYFTQNRKASEGISATHILSSRRTGSRWGIPQEVPLTPDSIGIQHPAIFPGGQRLYFVSDELEGGYGGKDIWYSDIVGDKFTPPVNAGEDINTSGDEVFPSFNDQGTLFFSSNGHPGVGALDLFKATYDPILKEWSVENMGSPFNSNADDFGVTFEDSEDKGFFSSNRKSAKGFDNIYRFEIPEYDIELSGKVLDARTKDPISEALIHLVGNDGLNIKLGTRSDGSFSENLNAGRKYVYLAGASGYLSKRLNVSTEDIAEDKEIYQQVELSSIYRPIVLEHVNYEFGSFELNSESRQSLDTLVQTMVDNPNITIEIESHTDNIGDSIFNLDLSNKRAMGVVDYLISKGIEADRLTAVGYGEDSPLVVDELLASQHSFLFEGDVLNQELIDVVTKKQVDIINSLNRRTAFKVKSIYYKPKDDKE